MTNEELVKKCNSIIDYYSIGNTIPQRGYVESFVAIEDMIADLQKLLNEALAEEDTAKPHTVVR